MFSIVPIIMNEYIGEDFSSKPTPKKYFEDDYVYYKNDNEILKLRLHFNHMDIVDLIEEYVKNDDVYDFEVLSEYSVKKKYNIGVNFFPFVGKYRIEGNLKKTNNYFVPKLTELLALLINLYNNSNNLITYNNFEKLYSVYINMKNKDINSNDINLLRSLLSKVYIVLEERLDVDVLSKQLDTTTKFIKNTDLELYKKIKYLLESAIDNENKFTELGIDFNVKEGLGLSKDNVKQLKR